MVDRHRQGQGKSGRRVVAVLGKLPTTANVRHVQTHLKKSVRLYQLEADPTMAWVSSRTTKLRWSCT
jgi:hypothetical protein